MPYLGNEPGAITDAFTDTFTGDGSETAFTLTQASTTNSVFVRIHGVMQRNGTDFTVDGTTLTFTTAPPNASNNVVVQFFTIGSVQAVADNGITLAKLAHGTDGNLITYDTAGAPAAVATGNDGQVLTSAGAGAPPAFEAIPAVTAGAISELTTQATTSGTTKNFAISAGAKRIKIIFDLVSMSGGSTAVEVQLGDAGGLETSGYVGTVMSTTTGVTAENPTNSFRICKDGEADANRSFVGMMTIVPIEGSNLRWIATSLSSATTGSITQLSTGAKTLSAELSQITILGGTFDAGQISVTEELV
jgi:hypothetical protein